MAKITMVEAIAMAHGWEMQHDGSVVVIGQDVGANGGVFRATAGLQARFGTDRVQDTPLAEATIAGMSVGMKRMTTARLPRWRYTLTRNRPMPGAA